MTSIPSAAWRPLHVACTAVMTFGLLLAGGAHAQEAWQQYGKRVQAAEAVQPLDNALMGDSISPVNGALSFSATDIDLPGNSSLRVAIDRTFSARLGLEYANDSMLTDWDLDLPAISGTFAPNWTLREGNQAPHSRRCSGYGSPTVPAISNQTQPGQALPAPRDFFRGYHINIPGVTSEELLWNRADNPVPGDGATYRFTTNSHVRVSCLTSLANGDGTLNDEGFLAITPDGTRYWFNHMAQYVEPSVRYHGSNIAAIRRNMLYATHVQDRFGNWVRYTYSNTKGQPGRLTRIESNDGRRIDIAYHAGTGRIATATVQATGAAVPQTWRYDYVNVQATGAGNRPSLRTVTRPDTSAWTIDMADFSRAKADYENENVSCLAVAALRAPVSPVARITHPSGAHAVIETTLQFHSKSQVQAHCANVTSPSNDVADDVARYVVNYYLLTTQSKTITGLGLESRTWTYAFASDGYPRYVRGATPMNPVCVGLDCWKPVCTSDSCAGRSRATITAPDGSWTRHEYGNTWQYDDGKLRSLVRGVGTLELDRVDYSYDLSFEDTPTYPAWFGGSLQSDGEGFQHEWVMPLVREVRARGGDTFEKAYARDAFARVNRLTETSTLGAGGGTHSRAIATQYFDLPSKWVMGQTRTQTLVATSSLYGLPAHPLSEIEYDPVHAVPLKRYAHGRLLQTMTYDLASGTTQSGTLTSVADARNVPGFDTRILLGNWSRGLPLQISHPATPDQPSGSSVGVTLTPEGWVKSVTDENGYLTGYVYDGMGRLSRVDFPDEPTVPGQTAAPWEKKHLTFQRSATAAFGLPANHWTHTVRTGAGYTIRHLDAMFRPVIEESYDGTTAATRDATRTLVVKRYDAAGRPAFTSYPVRTLTNYMATLAGTWTFYDALGRVTSVEQDSEYGTGAQRLKTSTVYEAGLRTRITSPRNTVTVTRHLAWGDPSFDLPVDIQHPEGAVTSITRDALGQPLAITRSGGTGGHTVTRAYTYDAHQQLCKTVEPETGATLMRYDAAGNLAWSAAGQTDTAGCGTLTHADRKSDRTYDQRGRLKTLRFTDTRGDQDWSYTPDGLPLSVVTVNRVGAVHPINQYVYNRRRMLVSETQHLPAWYSYSTAYSYDANGSVSRIHYPSTDYVDFAPNALGQATRARNSAGHDYAANVTYHPNGSIAGFTYGNGIVHAMTQNARQLPLQVTNTGVISDSYSYDANGNISGIVDAATSGNRTKAMTYDSLDRLLTAHSPVFGGDGYARYTYDVLDNLRSVKTATRDHTYWYDAKNQLTGVIDTATNGTVTGLAYDRSGNVQQKNGQAYDFDYGNRLREVLDVERYRYDAYGRRILAMNFQQGTITSLYSNAGQLLFQRNERVGEMKDIDHVYLAGSLIAQKETPVGGGTATIKYQHTDALGTPVVVTGAGQAVLDRVDYEPYGKALTPGNNTGKDRPGFTGHVEDRATSLTYMQQRYQDPELGVFLSVDPVTAYEQPTMAFNRYRYANNNPYTLNDPNGRQACPSRERCLEGSSTRNEPEQPGPSAERKAIDAQVVSAARSGKFSDGTKIDMSKREQSFSASESGTKAGLDQEQSCMKCGGEKVIRMTFSVPSGHSAGHTHGGDREQKPGVDDAPGKVGDTRYVITKDNVMGVDRTAVGNRVRILDGPMPTGRERRDIEKRIEGWNQNRNAPVMCAPSTGC